MAASAILDFEKLLPLLYYLTDRHQNLWKRWDFDLEHIDDVKMHSFKIQDVGYRYLEFRKTVAISVLFDQSLSNVVGILQR